MCTPLSTWMISPVVLGKKSESSATMPRPAGSGSFMSHASGARVFHTSASSPKPGMDLAAMEPIGPAEIRLQRMPSLPRSRAR